MYRALNIKVAKFRVALGGVHFSAPIPVFGYE